jgi:carboxylate-amine ligase
MAEDGRRALGVEEEFQLIDLRTRRLTPRAPELLELLSQDVYVEELQRCVIESNSGVHRGLDELRADLTRSRATLSAAAAELGLGVAAAGTVPLAVPTELQVTETPRYRRMLADYQLLAREQLICGTQVHVDVIDRDEAVRIQRRIAAYVPTILALSASSPFWSDGSDTGYASVRTLVWQRWPTTGISAHVDTAEEYDAAIDNLISSGVISDPGMVYFDVRPSATVNTLELRVCDSCPSVDTITLIAGLFRAMVVREAAAIAAGEPGITSHPTLERAALWRAARSGLEGDLVDVVTATPRPAAELVRALVADLRPYLEQLGDWDTVHRLSEQAIHVGSSASRQRRMLRRRGRLNDVVDLVIAETAGRTVAPSAADSDPGLLHGYQPWTQTEEPRTYDEAVLADGRAREPYAAILAATADLGPVELRKRQSQIEREQSIDGVTFRVSGHDRAQVFPLDVIPRILDAEQWEAISDGVAQRALALNAFLRDVYGPQRIVADGVIPIEVLDRAPGFRSVGSAPSWATVRAHVCGVDLVSTEPGSFLVLEDNLRIPSGVSYAIANRRLMARFFPEIPRPDGLLDVSAATGMLAETLAAARPPRCVGAPACAVLTSGWEDSAYFEHKMLADGAVIPLLSTSDLLVHEGIVYHVIGDDRQRVDVLYARIDEEMLMSSVGADGNTLRSGLTQAMRKGTLAFANSLGNGVGDDKAVYAYVPAMIEYYLGEKPRIGQVNTWLCAERSQRDYVLDHLDELVVKPIDGYGGIGITIGPHATEDELIARRRELVSLPERYIAQEVLNISTHPTFDGSGLYPHHIDLRVFVHLRGGPDGVTAHPVPAALTRVAPAGSLIVNSSRGGGGKDTWIVSR